MPSKPRLLVDQCAWVRSALTDSQYIFRSLRNALQERGAPILTLNGPKDREGLEKIKKFAWGCDTPMILDGLMPQELKALRPVFTDRKNFSMCLVDWWTSVYWFTRNADYLIFRNYNGIAIRRGMARFAEGRRPPLWLPPEKWIPFHIASSALRLPALAAAPVLEIQKWFQRRAEIVAPEKLLYFPFTIAEEHVPLKSEPAEFDFANVSGTGGYWVVRDPFASAWLNFGNLYYDRIRITDLILGYENRPYKVFDLRRAPAFLPWDSYCDTVRRSRFVIATGGLHQNSVAKYTEFACLGTPMIGEEIPFEFPWLGKCLFPVNTLHAGARELESQLKDAMARQAELRENCLALRETLLKLYHPQRILEILQDQIDGRPIPPGYLKEGAI